jgi:hypothetical protein
MDEINAVRIIFKISDCRWWSLYTCFLIYSFIIDVKERTGSVLTDMIYVFLEIFDFLWWSLHNNGEGRNDHVSENTFVCKYIYTYIDIYMYVYTCI